MSSPAIDKVILNARGLRKTYELGRRRVEVLRGVDLEVRAGEFVALRGASGAGKSTLLHLLGGLDVPDEGTVEFDGRPLPKSGESAIARFRNSRVGLIFQAYHLLPELDALENVCLPARLARRPVDEVEKEGLELLKRVGLADRADHRPSELSGGEQQRVAIARAMINRPDLILADEPTGNLDSKTGGAILELLQSLQTERQATLIIATHDLRLAESAPRLVQLVDGMIQN
ncbi:MAG TPA: ABC transporter ATP-binding protein [Roseimicrobium sp.]|nr:ABC transporter ATP-binding protein [Roseimicrobium sp.]